MEDKPDFEQIIEDEAQGRYPVTSTTGDIYVGSKATFKHGCRYTYNSHVLPLQSELSSAQEKNRRLLEALKDSVERMKRARGILTERDGQPDCWQMLNTEYQFELISEIENKKV